MRVSTQPSLLPRRFSRDDQNVVVAVELDQPAAVIYGHVAVDKRIFRVAAEKDNHYRILNLFADQRHELAQIVLRELGQKSIECFISTNLRSFFPIKHSRMMRFTNLLLYLQYDSLR